MRDAGGDDLAGQSVEAAAAAVVERGRAPDEGTAASRLETVAEDGTVSWEGVRTALRDVSTVVSTPETRLELARAAYADAREAADGAPDRPVVAARLGRYDRRLADVESRIEGLGDELSDLVERAREQDDLYAVARDIRALEGAANECQGIADEIAVDLEAFERWLDDPDRRYAELEGDVEAVAEAIDGLEETVDAIAAATTDGAGDTEEVAAGWFDAAVRHRSLAPMLEDLRWELDGLREWVDRPESADIDRRLEELAKRRSSVGEGLNAVATVDHVRRFSRALAAVDRDLGELDPPIKWAAVEETLAEHRDAAPGRGVDAG